MGDRQLTVRTSWVFGPERQGKNFAYQLLRNLAEGKPMVCPSDQVSSPSYGTRRRGPRWSGWWSRDVSG